MKCLLLVTLLICTVFQASAYHRYYRPHQPSRKITLRANRVNKVGWKKIVAGGVAGGTLIAAYKISDGIQEGTKTAAKEHPETFGGSISGLLLPVYAVLWSGFLVFLLLAILKVFPWFQNLKRKEEI